MLREGQGRVRLLTLGVLLLAFLLDVATPQALVAAILFGVPIALSGMAFSPRFTWGTVALALLGNLTAGVLNAKAEGGLSVLAVANRLLAGLSMALVGYLTLALLRRAEAQGRVELALRRAEALARVYRALDLDLDPEEPEATLLKATERLARLFGAEAAGLWKKAPGGPALVGAVGPPPLGVPGRVVRAWEREAPGPVEEGVFAFPLGRYLVLLEGVGPEGEARLKELALEIQGRLQAFWEKAQHVSALKELAYSLSHDLRTPLTANLLNLRLALQGAYGPLDEAFRQALANGVAANEALLRLADNLLELARFALSGREPEAVPLKALAEEVAGALGPLFAARGLECRVEGEEAWVLGQRDALARAVQHLLENALEHAPPGSRVSVRLEAWDGVVRLGVEDEGPGVPEALLPHLFRRPVREGRGGLGLYLTRRILEAHGGRVGYERREGRTVFYLELEEVRHASPRVPG
ncbi:sensor histidine kinase [Thermus thalpophilus]|uniref:sensor histidine kinase n=1 Tax=Thermus thalpophilus TaxID=2908147 RepID=UPI001FA9A24E